MFPLTFVDEQGKLTRYPWHDYPMLVALVPDPIEWSEVVEGAAPRMQRVTIVKVWHGPAGEYPELPTADEFAEGLRREGWWWL